MQGGKHSNYLSQGNQTLLSPTICGLLSLALLSIGHFSGLSVYFQTKSTIPIRANDLQSERLSLEQFVYAT